MEYELRPIYDSRQSFYSKAIVRTEDNKTILRSYSTDVVFIENNKAIVKGSYSQTTLRHIKEFLRQNHFKAETLKQIEEDYSPTEDQLNKEREEAKKKTDSMFKTIGMVAKIGELMTDNQKDSNSWKARMLKAGLENKGLIMPEDWDTLTEDEKERRLNGVIELTHN